MVKKKDHHHAAQLDLRLGQHGCQPEVGNGEEVLGGPAKEKRRGS